MDSKPLRHHDSVLTEERPLNYSFATTTSTALFQEEVHLTHLLSKALSRRRLPSAHMIIKM